MKENDKEKSEVNNQQRFTPFRFATLVTLPFALALGRVLWGWYFNQPLLPDFLVPIVLLCPPLILALASIGLVSIIISWKRSPHWCRFVLLLYSLIIIIFVVLLFESAQGV